MTDGWRERLRARAGKVELVLRHVDALANVAALLQARVTPLGLVALGLSGARFLSAVLRPPDEFGYDVGLPPVLVGLLKSALGLCAGQDSPPAVVAGAKIYVGGSGGLYTTDASPALRAALLAEVGRHVRARQHHACLLRTTADDVALSEYVHHGARVPGSRLAERVWARQAPMVRDGLTRVVLLYGPPGTAKSTAARNLTRLVVREWPESSSMRVSVGHLNDMGVSAMEAVVDAAAPDVLVLEDLHELREEAGMLDFLEARHGRQRLVVVTCNNHRALSPAFRRPERVDDVYEVTGCDPETVTEVLGPLAGRLTDAQREECCTWPVAHVVALARVLKYVEGADVAAEMSSLRARAEEGTLPA